MKSLVVSIALLMIGFAASADIARPGNISTSTVVGAAAEDLFNGISGPELTGDVLRTQSSVYRVDRAADGLEQTICEKTVYQIIKKPDDYRCTIQRSNDGQPVPLFNPPRRVG